MKVPLAEALKARPEQRRAFQRYPMSLAVLVQPAAEGVGGRRKIETAVVTDASLSGLVFVSSRPYSPGSVVDIQIGLGAHLHLIRAVIRRNQPVALPGRRVFQCAAQFVRGECMARFIPAFARSLYQRFGANSFG